MVMVSSSFHLMWNESENRGFFVTKIILCGSMNERKENALDGAVLFPDLAFYKSLIEEELTRCKEEQYELPPVLALT